MEFRILGPLEVVDGGRSLSIRRGKEQTLLAYLLLHANGVVPSARLVDELWDGHPPATAPKILHNAVSHLRRELGDGRLLTRDPGYVLRVAAGELDADEFERLAKEGRADEALALWRGPPLLELQDERFVDDARRRLEELRLNVVEDRVDRDLAAGRHTELVPELEQLVREHPLRDRLRGQLMVALYGAGRQADALEIYRDGRRTLSDELGLEPGPQLQELERRILTQDPALLPPPTRPRPRVTTTRRRSRRLALLGMGAAALVAAIVGGILYATGEESKPLLATKNSLAAIDPTSNRVIGVVPIGDTPRGVAAGAGRVWTANAGEGTVSMVDPQDLKVVRTIGVGVAATDLVVADRQVWIAAGGDNKLARLDAHSGGLLETREISRDRTASAYAVTATPTAVWVASGDAVYEVDPATQTFTGNRHFGHAGVNDVAVKGGAVWLATSAQTIERLSKSDLHERDRVELGTIPISLVVANGSVWAAAGTPRGPPRAALVRLDEQTARVTQTVVFKGSVGFPPTVQVAYGAGALWVATYDDGHVFRVDPRDGTIVARIKVGGHPAGIAVGEDRVWVTVG